MEEIYDRAGTEATLSTDDLLTIAQDHPQFQNLFKKKSGPSIQILPSNLLKFNHWDFLYLCFTSPFFISVLMFCLFVHIFLKTASAHIISVTHSMKFKGLNPVKQTVTAKANLSSCHCITDSEISRNSETVWKEYEI